jgi:HAD superfamily hydrolase (TIGR01509 family)
MIPAIVIFDCDGVLVDTEAVSNEVMSAALAHHGYRISVEESRRRFVGRTMESIQSEVEAEVGRPLGTDWPERVRTATEAAFDRGVRPIPGVEEAIKAVIGAGLKYCVASSGRFSKMRKSLGQAGLLHYFDHVMFSAEQVQRGKPAPDLFLFASARMEGIAAECVVIEDSVPGVQAGFAAGMRTLAYAGDSMSVEAGLIETGAQAFFDMMDLPALLGIATPR